MYFTSSQWAVAFGVQINIPGSQRKGRISCGQSSSYYPQLTTVHPDKNFQWHLQIFLPNVKEGNVRFYPQCPYAAIAIRYESNVICGWSRQILCDLDPPSIHNYFLAKVAPSSCNLTPRLRFFARSFASFVGQTIFDCILISSSPKPPLTFSKSILKRNLCRFVSYFHREFRGIQMTACYVYYY